MKRLAMQRKCQKTSYVVNAIYTVFHIIYVPRKNEIKTTFGAQNLPTRKTTAHDNS